MLIIFMKDIGTDSFVRAKEQMESVIVAAMYPYKFLGEHGVWRG